MTAADFERIKSALCEIACGRKLSSGGHDQRMCRDELQTTARIVCEHFGWDYRNKTVFRLDQVAS